MNSVELLTNDAIVFQFDFQEKDEFPREVRTGAESTKNRKVFWDNTMGFTDWLMR